MNKKIYNILSIEDNKPDFILLEKALKKIENIDINVINIPNGKTALDFVYKRGKYNKSPTPDLIIIDINLPLLSGQEIIKILKEDQKYRIIPIIVFSTSDAEKDILESYKLHANSYITKTFDIKELFQKISSLGEYWLKTNEPSPIQPIYVVKKEKE